jgi:hypothetical protein
MSGVRGQTTLFFAIGLVLLIIVALIFLLLNRTTSAPETIDIANSRVLSQYVGSCLDTAVNDELEDLGKTGGVSLSKGYPYATVKLGDESVPVIYGITKNRRTPGDAGRQGDIVPYIESGTGKPVLPGGSTNYYGVNLMTMLQFRSATRINPATGNSFFPIPTFSDGYFGQVNFPPLCAKDGPNGLGSTALCAYYAGTPPGMAQATSVQETLTARVQERVQQCVALDQFRDAIGPEVSAVSAPNVTLKFTRNNVLVTLIYNLTLQGKAQVSTVPFERRYDVRYLAVAEYAYALARQESRDITFDIAAEYNDRERLPYLDGFSVEKTALSVTDRSTGSLSGFSAKADPARADLITITDDYSKIRGQKFRFNFLIERRPPMLNLTANDECKGTAWDPDDGFKGAPRIIGGRCAVVDNDGDIDENAAISS